MIKRKNLLLAIIFFSITIIFNILAELNIANNLLKYLNGVWVIIPAIGIYFTFIVNRDSTIKLWIKIILNLVAFIYLFSILFLIFGFIIFGWLKLA